MDVELTGKTIQSVQDPAPGDDGAPDGSRLILHFTDGTHVMLEGDDYLSVSALTNDDLEALRTKQAEHEQKEQDRKAERNRWLALTCEQRQARLITRRASESPSQKMMRTIIRDDLRRANEVSWWIDGGKARTVKDPCDKCEETACPNAQTRQIPPFTPRRTRTKARRT